MAEVSEAVEANDVARLCEAAHKLYGLVSAFSTVAGSLTSEIEDHAARGDLEQARPLVGRLEAMAPELIRQVESVSLESLRGQAKTAEGGHRAPGA
jgi:hypothetical protein